MTIKTFTFNPFQENTYVVHDHNMEAVVIDAGCYNQHEADVLKQYVDDNGLKVKRILNTHLHIDHHFGNSYMYQFFGLSPEAHKADEFLINKSIQHAQLFGLAFNASTQNLGSYIEEDQQITIGDIVFDCIHVPGHSPGSIAFYNKNENVLFVGDVLFMGSIGRTDLEQGSYPTLIQSIRKKLLPLPDATVVYPGHGPSTTIGYEKVNNPYI